MRVSPNPLIRNNKKNWEWTFELPILQVKFQELIFNLDIATFINDVTITSLLNVFQLHKIPIYATRQKQRIQRSSVLMSWQALRSPSTCRVELLSSYQRQVSSLRLNCSRILQNYNKYPRFTFIKTCRKDLLLQRTLVRACLIWSHQ